MNGIINEECPVDDVEYMYLGNSQRHMVAFDLLKDDRIQAGDVTISLVKKKNGRLRVIVNSPEPIEVNRTRYGNT